MADVSPSQAPAASAADDWPAQAADTIVKVVGTVRDNTTGKAITAARGVVYGILAGLLALVALVLVCILTDRGLTVLANSILGWVDLDRPGRGAWIADVILGGAFTLAGWALWKKANATTAD